MTKCRVTLANLAVTLSSALAKCRVALIDLAIKLGLTSAGNDEDNKNDSNAKNDDVEAGSNTKRDVLNNDPMTVFPVALSANTNDNAGNSEDNKNDSNAKDDVEEATNSTTKDA